MDDAIAILMCIKEAERRGYELLAITTSFGNVKLPQVLKNIAKILDVLPAGKSIPVYAGCSKPIVSNTTDYFPWHGLVSNNHVHPPHWCPDSCSQGPPSIVSVEAKVLSGSMPRQSSE